MLWRRFSANDLVTPAWSEGASAGGGFDWVLLKPVSSDQLFHSVERALARHEIARGLKSKLDMVRAPIAALTPREREVFELVIRGNTNKQVARALNQIYDFTTLRLY